MNILTALKKTNQLLIVLLFIVPIDAKGQGYGKRAEGQVSFGLASGTLNFKESVNAGFAFNIGFNLLSIKNASLSLGTSIKFGFENKDGLGYAGLALTVIVQPPPDNLSFNFAEFPLSLHYNYGYGASSKATNRFGFYFGGGISYLVTGYANGTNNLIPASFWGYSADAGIRIGAFELGFSKVFSLGGGVPGIATPAFYELTLNGFLPTWKK